MSYLAYLFKESEFDTFCTDCWGKKAYYGPLNVDTRQLLTWDTVAKWLQDPDLFKRIPVHLRSSNFELDVPSPTSYGDVIRGLEQGYTLQVRRLQDILPKESTLMRLAKALQQTTLQPLDSLTFFYALPGSMPTAIHKDISEIFSLQLTGKKQWRLGQEKILTDQMSFNEDGFQLGQKNILSQGEFIYIPSYLPHQVQCVEHSSASIAFVFKSIQLANIISYLGEDDVLKKLLLKPLPIVGKDVLDKQAEIEIENLLTCYCKLAKAKGASLIIKEIFEHVKTYLASR